ncbi:putative gustatory receptor 28b [Topomyia yanbarensis]|uniref:putative gustatory receptor 28b n=1 Tax=Topomyia yanbarensis TaxID=2498891 RepID=UPI00273A798D|nr:putative gustatory receptor 28b [Topomyia yanbarensis]
MLGETFREFFNPKNFYAAQRPILRMTFFTGLTPFTVLREGSEVVLKCTTFGYLNSCIHIVIFCTCYVIALVNQESVTAYFFSTEISTLGDFLQIMIGLAALVMAFFYTIFRRNKLIQAFKSLARTDEHFKEIDVETNYKSTLLHNYLIVFIQIFVQASYWGISFTVTNLSNVRPSAAAWISFLLPFTLTSMIISLFLCLVNQAKHRFYLLNKILGSLKEISMEKHLEKRDSAKVIKFQKPLGISSVFSNTNRYLPDVINRVTRIQDELCDACSGVEEYFKEQMLTIVTIAFLIVVFDSYYILETIFTDTFVHTSFSRVQFVVFFLCQATLHAFGVLKIVYVSSRAVTENDKIAANVHKLINVNSYDDEVVKQLAHLSMQLTHRKIMFTAYGFFNLDFTLLFTLVGAATTYLIILVQFTLNQNELCGQKLINSTIKSLGKNASHN